MTMDIRDTVEPLTRWLISASEERKTITYREAGSRLEKECGLSGIHPRNLGIPADAVMDRLLSVDESAPLLISLLVRMDTGRPGLGFFRKWLSRKYPFDERDGMSRKRAIERAMEDVYAYGRWGELYERLYGNEDAELSRSRSACGGEGRSPGAPRSSDPLIPNDETVRAIEAARRGELVSVGDVDGLMAHLNADD